MGEDEVFILIVAIVIALVGVAVNSTAALHRLFFRANPGPGIVRLGVLLAMAWVAFVIWRYADPSVTGVYVWFYLVLGYAVIKLCGQTSVRMFGLHPRIDAAERRNIPAAFVIAAFTAATGMIFGGSLWGEADPVGDDEGGWWIPLTFFLLGWAALLIAFGMFVRREQARFAQRIRRERSMADARAAAAFLFSSAVLLTDAVAGDFWGWRHGLLSFGVLAAMLLAHEGFASFTRPHGPATAADGGRDARRVVESAVYLGMAFVAWFLSRMFDTAWGAG